MPAIKTPFNATRLAAMLETHGLEAIVATTKENIRYLTGFSPVVKVLRPYGGRCYAIVARGTGAAVHVVHSSGEADQVLDATCEIGQVALYGTFYREYGGWQTLQLDELQLRSITEQRHIFPTHVAAFREIFTRLGIAEGRVALDEDGITLPDASELQDSVSERLTWTAGSALLRSVRQVKTPHEVSILARAAQILEESYEHVAHSARIGSTETALVHEFQRYVVEQGGLPTLAMMKIGRHAVGGQRRQQAHIALQADDVLWFDCDVQYQDYWADIARVYSAKASSEVERKYTALLHGQREAIRRTRPGMTGDDVFHLTMQAVHAAGFPEYRRHHVGHGIGLEPYEPPILAPGNTDIIETGAVLSIETPYYEFGVGALHVEDPILVGVAGNERLTRSSGAFGRLVM